MRIPARGKQIKLRFTQSPDANVKRRTFIRQLCVIIHSDHTHSRTHWVMHANTDAMQTCVLFAPSPAPLSRIIAGRGRRCFLSVTVPPSPPFTRHPNTKIHVCSLTPLNPVWYLEQLSWIKNERYSLYLLLIPCL